MHVAGTVHGESPSYAPWEFTHEQLGREDSQGGLGREDGDAYRRFRPSCDSVLVSMYPCARPLSSCACAVLRTSLVCPIRGTLGTSGGDDMLTDLLLLATRADVFDGRL